MSNGYGPQDPRRRDPRLPVGIMNTDPPPDPPNRGLLETPPPGWPQNPPVPQSLLDSPPIMGERPQGDFQDYGTGQQLQPPSGIEGAIRRAGSYVWDALKQRRSELRAESAAAPIGTPEHDQLVADQYVGLLSGLGVGVGNVGSRLTTGLMGESEDPRSLQQRFGQLEEFSRGKIPESVRGQTMAQIGGFVPEFNPAADLADLLNVPGYMKEGNLLGAGLSALGAIPLVGTPMVKAIKIRKLGKAKRLEDESFVGGPKYTRTTDEPYGTQPSSAPARVNSTETYGAMLDDYVRRVMLGIDGRDWYVDSARWIEDAMGSPEHAKELARILAITSSQTGVSTNLNFAVQAALQRAVGIPTKTGRFPEEMSKKIDELVEKIGPKRTPFWENLMAAGDPERAVHDIWQGRAFGYEHISPKPYKTKKEAIKSITTDKGKVRGRVWKEDGGWMSAGVWDEGFSPTQHAFMDDAMDEVVDYLNANKVGGHTDWNRANAQAAAWSGIQIETGALKAEDAAMSFGDYADAPAAQGTYEGVMRPDPAHAPSAQRGEMSYEDRAKFAEEGMLPPTDQDTDRYYAALSLPQQAMRIIRGVYRNPNTGKMEYNPGRLSRPLVYSKKGELVAPAREILDTVEGGRAYIDFQNAGAWHHLIPESQVTPFRATSIRIALDGSPTRKQLEALQDIADREGMFVVDTGKGVHLIEDVFRRSEVTLLGGTKPTDVIADLMKKAETKGKKSLTDDELKILKKWRLYGETLGKELKGDFGDELIDILPDGTLSRQQIESGYIEYADLWKTHGERHATMKFLEDLEARPALAEALEPELMEHARLAYERNIAHRDRTGDPLRADVQNALKILMEQGLAGLRKAVNDEEVLPSIAVLSALGLQNLFPADATDRPSGGLLR